MWYIIEVFALAALFSALKGKGSNWSRGMAIAFGIFLVGLGTVRLNDASSMNAILSYEADRQTEYQAGWDRLHDQLDPALQQGFIHLIAGSIMIGMVAMSKPKETS